MIIVSKEEGAKWPNLGSLTELRGFYGIDIQVHVVDFFQNRNRIYIYLLVYYVG